MDPTDPCEDAPCDDGIDPITKLPHNPGSFTDPEDSILTLHTALPSGPGDGIVDPTMFKGDMEDPACTIDPSNGYSLRACAICVAGCVYSVEEETQQSNCYLEQRSQEFVEQAQSCKQCNCEQPGQGCAMSCSDRPPFAGAECQQYAR